LINKFSEHLSDNNGLTLVELLISIALLGVVVALASTMLVQSLNVIEPSMRRMSAGQLTELAKSELATYLRTATIPVDETEDTWTFTGYHPSTDEADLIHFEIIKDNGSVRVIAKDGEEEIENRTVVNYVEDLEINNVNNGFKIYVRVVDSDGNVAHKRATVRSRNLIDE